MKPSKIGVLDSGMGGLYVLKELFEKYPFNTYYFYGDTKNLPFGNKSKEDLIKIGENIIRYFESLNVDIIVIACGTLSSFVFDTLKEKTKIPLINIIDYTLRYVNQKYENVLVLSTLATMHSNYFQNNLLLTKRVIGLEKLAYLIENDLDYIDYLDSILPNENYDAIILGCTHFVKIKDYLKEKYQTDIVDMGNILANNLVLSDDGIKNIFIYFSKLTDTEINNVYKIFRKEDVTICPNLPK